VSWIGGGVVKAMIPFTASMLLGCRPGRYPVQTFVIIEPPVSTYTTFILNGVHSKATNLKLLVVYFLPLFNINPSI
jgi:hypothetical protein